MNSIAGYTAIGTFGGHTYYISNNTTNFATAQSNAVAAGGGLVIISSAAENAFVAAAVTGETYIGLSDASTEGITVWVDGSTPAGLGYSNFCSHGSAGNNTARDYLIVGASNCATDEWAYRQDNTARVSIIEINGENTTNCSVMLSSGLASGSNFPKGVSTVEWEGTDVAGNMNTCSFTVTVNDNENPTLACPSNQTITTSSNGMGDCTGEYAFGDPLTENCPGGTWSA
ncbi:MAG: HYR domain-containing protein, partial [Candidatus Nitrotoga sp.]